MLFQGRDCGGQIFSSFSGYDKVDNSDHQYYDCVLAQEIGNHKKGEVIECICMSYSQGEMEFLEDGIVIESYPIELKIGRNRNPYEED